MFRTISDILLFRLNDYSYIFERSIVSIDSAHQFDGSDEQTIQSLISLLAFDPLTVDHDYVILFPRSTVV